MYDEKLKALYLELRDAKKAKDGAKIKSLKADIKAYTAKKAEAKKASKAEMDNHAYFARAAKPYLDAEKLVTQEENYKHLGEIEDMYEEAKARKEKAEAEAEAKALKEKEEQEAYAAQLKADKVAVKNGSALSDKEKVEKIRMYIFLKNSGKITQEEYKEKIDELYK